MPAAASHYKHTMKTKLLKLTAVAAVTFLASCSKSPDSGATTSAPPAASPAPASAAPDPSLPEKKVEITGNDQMKFDVLTIEAKPGQKITLTLKNAGTMPKMSMGHNFVLLANDVDVMKFIEASQTHMANEFIAPELKSKVIAHTKLLGPGESDTISFAAPRKPGAYNYLCSFPGHHAIGMKGVLTVQ